MTELYVPIFNFYKKFGKLMKLILCPILLLCFVLWIIGNFVHLNTLFMFVIGLITATVLMYFYGGYIYGYIDKMIAAIQGIVQEISTLF